MSIISVNFLVLKEMPDVVKLRAFLSLIAIVWEIIVNRHHIDTLTMLYFISFLNRPVAIKVRRLIHIEPNS